MRVHVYYWAAGPDRRIDKNRRHVQTVESLEAAISLMERLLDTWQGYPVAFVDEAGRDFDVEVFEAIQTVSFEWTRPSLTEARQSFAAPTLYRGEVWMATAAAEEKPAEEKPAEPAEPATEYVSQDQLPGATVALAAADRGEFALLEAWVQQYRPPVAGDDITLTRESDGIIYYRSPGGRWSRHERTERTGDGNE